MQTSKEWAKIEKIRRADTPLHRYNVCLEALDASFWAQKELLDEYLKAEQARCKHKETLYHMGPDGWRECLICGKTL